MSKYFECIDGSLVDPKIVDAVYKTYDYSKWVVSYALPLDGRILVAHETVASANNEIKRFKEFSDGEKVDDPKWNI